MKASRDDLNGLLRLQEIDLDITKQKKALDELPQNEIIRKAQKQRESVLERQTRVKKLKESAHKQQVHIEDEDTSLAEKEASAQSALDSAQGDFRSVEAHTKELESITRRREKLAQDRAQLDDDMSKIETLEKQIDQVIDDADKTEALARESYQDEADKLHASISDLEAQREDLVTTMDKDIVKLYDKTAPLTGGVAVSTLKGSSCGACRTTFDGGRLIDLKSQAPLGICPACKRLLVIE